MVKPLVRRLGLARGLGIRAGHLGHLASGARSWVFKTVMAAEALTWDCVGNVWEASVDPGPAAKSHRQGACPILSRNSSPGVTSHRFLPLCRSLSASKAETRRPPPPLLQGPASLA